jgi:hypothetical protein
MNKKADVPETLEWIVASIIILAIMVIYIILVLFLFASPTSGWSVRYKKQSNTQNNYLNTQIAINYLNSEMNREKIINIIQEKGTNSKTEIEEHTKNYFKNQAGIWEVIITSENQQERISNKPFDSILYEEMNLCPISTETVNMHFENSEKQKTNLKILFCTNVRDPDLKMEGGP